MFLPICNSENGDFIMLPFSGSLMDQPYMTMQILLVIQSAFRQVLSARMEKIKAGNRGSARRRK